MKVYKSAKIEEQIHLKVAIYCAGNNENICDFYSEAASEYLKKKKSNKKKHINGFSLELLGFTRNGTSYLKNKDLITYDGATWLLNGREVQFMEDINFYEI